MFEAREIRLLSRRLVKTLKVLENGALASDTLVTLPSMAILSSDSVSSTAENLSNIVPKKPLLTDEKLRIQESYRKKTDIVLKLFMDQYRGKDLSKDKYFMQMLPASKLLKQQLIPLYQPNDSMKKFYAQARSIEPEGSETNYKNDQIFFDIRSGYNPHTKSAVKAIRDRIRLIRLFTEQYNDSSFELLDTSKPINYSERNSTEVLLNDDVLSETFQEEHYGLFRKRMEYFKDMINLFGNSSIVLILQNKNNSISDVTWQNMTQELKNISKSKRNKRPDNSNGININDIRSRYQSLSFTKRSNQFIITSKIDEFMFLYALKYLSLDANASDIRSPSQIRTLFNKSSETETISDVFFEFMAKKFSDSMTRSMNQLSKVVESEDELVESANSNEITDSQVIEDVAVLKSLMKNYHAVVFNFENFVNNGASIATITKQVQRAFEILNKYINQEKEYEIVFADLGYNRIPSFDDEMKDAIDSTKAIKEKQYGYEYFLELAKINRKKRSRLLGEENGENKSINGVQGDRSDKSALESTLFEVILNEIANNNLTVIDKASSGERLYFHS